MSIPFPSNEWIKAVADEVNKSKAYQEAAKTWEGDICFVINAGAGVTQDTFLYMDLWHGQCRQAYQLDEPGQVNSEFKIAAPLPTWKRVLEGQLDPIRALMGRQLKLEGNMMKVMKAPKAAIELVNCAKKVDTEWPA